jgi:hypothetical protein
MSKITDAKRAEIYSNFTGNHTSTTVIVDDLKVYEFFGQAQDNNSLNNNIPFNTASFFDSDQQTFTQGPQVVHNHYHSGSGVPWWWFWFMNSGSTNHVYVHNQHEDEKKDSNFFAYIVVLLIAAAVALPAVIGGIYLLSELWHNLERLYYNEGYLHAALGFTNIVMSIGLSAMLSNMFLASVITGLTISAGFANPITWSFFILGCVTLIMAAVMHLATQELIYGATAYFNQDALNPEEPKRFSISDAQTQEIQRINKRLAISQGNNPNAVKAPDRDKCQNVITVMYHDMTQDCSFFQRTFRFNPLFRDETTAKNLAAIRQLRTTGQVNYQTKVFSSDEDDLVGTTLNFTTKSLYGN